MREVEDDNYVMTKRRPDGPTVTVRFHRAARVGRCSGRRAALARPDGRPKDEVVHCPECGCELRFNWDVVPPPQAKLDEGANHGEALHPDADECAVARVAVARSDASDVIPVEWYRREGSTVSRAWDAPNKDVDTS